MRRALKFYPIPALAALLVTCLAALAVLFGASAARAADPIYPMASVAGLVPPDGMDREQDFPGLRGPQTATRRSWSRYSPPLFTRT